MFKIIKCIILIASGISLITAKPVFYDSLTIPGCKYYISLNDTNSPLDSVTKICTNYYYFSNKMPVTDSNYISKFLIIKEKTSVPCTLSFTSSDDYLITQVVNILKCDSLPDKFSQEQFTNYVGDTFFVNWGFVFIHFAKIIATPNPSNTYPSGSIHLRISLFSNTDSANLYMSKPYIVIPPASVKNQVLNKSNLRERKYALIFNSGRQQNSENKLIYNIRGQTISKSGKDNLIIEYK